jgi:hypothetical protein
MMAMAIRVRSFVVDMSYAQMKALEHVFPSADILTCHFHILRAV